MTIDELFVMSDPIRWIDDLMTRVPRAEGILNAYIGSDRGYHGLFHLALMWRACHLLKLPMDGSHKHRMACAVAYHDAVYDARKQDNEEASAVLWESAAASTKVSTLTVLWVSRAIRASADHFAERASTDRHLLNFLSMDLLPLAAPSPMFIQHSLMIRAEYSHLSDAEWKAGRRAFLQRAMTTTIYRSLDLFSEPVRHELETRAKANIVQALAGS